MRTISMLTVAVPFVLVLAGRAAAAESDAPTLLSVRRIWDRAPHNAFTDLVRFRDRWYCAFREGKAHASPDGALRVIRSEDGRSWESAARLTYPKADARDAKLSVTPDGRLMLSGAAALHQPAAARHQSLAWFSDTGDTFGEAHAIGRPDDWMWSAAWHKGVAYSIGYRTVDPRSTRLYHSRDGRTWEVLVDRLFTDGYPNETSLVFAADDTACCLLRRDGTKRTAQLGTAKPPYKDWTWKDLGVQIGGPKMIQLPDGRLLAAVRLYRPTRTSLCWVDPEKARLTECLKLPSGGDTSYAGLVLHDGTLRVSYYSSHERKTSIYLAAVRIPGKEELD